MSGMLATMFARSLGFVALLAGAAAAQDARWTRFRGPDGNGVATEATTLPVEFGPETNRLWTCPVPAGNSSPCVWDGRLFVTGAETGELVTLCIDRATGDTLWRRAIERGLDDERRHEINSPASPTPTTDGERVYVYFGTIGLVCYDFEGEELWRRTTPTPANTFGTAASPIVAGDRVLFVHDSNADSFLEALEPETGKPAWRRDRPGFGSGWSTPAVWRYDGVDELLVNGVWWVTAYDLADGSERWSVPGLTDEPIVTPATGAGLVFVSSYNMKTNPEVIGLPEFDALLEQYDEDKDGKLNRNEADANKSILSRSDADGEGDHPLRIFFNFLDGDKDGFITSDEWKKIVRWLDAFEHANALFAIRPGGPEHEAEIVWQHARGIPECPSPLFYRDRVYLVKNGGMATCLDAATGAVKFQERLDSRGPCYASPVAGDGKIYTASARGVVTVFAAADELSVLARNDLGERIMATPALVDGRIYVRTERNVHAFGEPNED